MNNTNIPSGGMPSGGFGFGTIETLLRFIVQAINSLTTAITNAFPAPLAGSATWNPPNLASGASETTTVTVAGAVLGQRSTASFSLTLAGLTLSSYVSAADSVTVVLSNLTGGAVDLASGTVKCWVWSN